MFDAQQPNYQSLRSVIAERTNPLVFWVGAGLSAAAGLPTWPQLKDLVCSHFRRHYATLDGESGRKQLEDVASIQAETDLWVAFSRLQDLGRTTFEEAVRQAFSESPRCGIPRNYRRLFQMNAKGIVTLNIDRLAARAFSMERPGVTPLEFCGNQCGAYAHVLKGPNTFILNAHGVYENTGSWILRTDQRKWLFADAAYRGFIQAVLANHMVVFVGVSADDVAVTSHLHRLAENGIKVQGHYWVTDRSDFCTDRWAEDEGILVIRYPGDNDHAALEDMLDDLARFRPRDPDQLAPVAPCAACPASEHLQPPDELIREPEEAVREKLNAHARFLLRDGNPSRYADYEQFRREYDKCIHHCWYVATEPPHNLLMGYEIVREIAEGAFGRVFEAKTGSGRRVAVKLLREEARRKPEMLQSFRRGVRAMRILSENDVDGMVGYTDCSEIPAFAVMDLVDGPNLGEAVRAGYLDDWQDLLRFAIELSSVIRRAHQLALRVLHRDIRPANIMLKDYEANPDQSHVVVLDFDLSWHRDALEVSVTQGPAMHGYLAPELTDPCLGYSTRNAAVDSFGLGMTFYFMRTKADPTYMQHRHASWAEDVSRRVLEHRCPTWVSLPRRFADLILLCTHDCQPERCDVAHIFGELTRLREALITPANVRAADLLCHELGFRCASGLGQVDALRWDYDSQRASITLASGVSLVLGGDDKKTGVSGSLSWENMGRTEFKKVRKYLSDHADQAMAVLRKGGFQTAEYPSFSGAGARFDFQCPSGVLAARLEGMGKSVSDALGKLRLD